MGQRNKRFIPVDITLYLPTPDKRKAVPNIINSEGIGNKIKYFRLKKGLTRDELAKISGVSCAYLAEIEQKNRINIHPLYIQKIADGLGIDPLKLISPNGSSKKKKHFIDYLIPPDTLGAKIKNLRLKRGFTLKEFTRKVGLSKDCIWRYEKDITVPEEKILKRIAKVLKVNISELTNNNRKERKKWGLKGLRDI